MPDQTGTKLVVVEFVVTSLCGVATDESGRAGRAPGRATASLANSTDQLCQVGPITAHL